MQKRRVFLIGFTTGLWEEAGMKLMMAEESDGWGEFEGVGDFEDILADAEEDGIRHLDPRDSEKYSHCNGAEDCGDAWHVYDHRLRGGSISTKKDRDLFRGRSG